MRLDLTISEFLVLAEGIREALEASGKFAPYSVDQFDPMFLMACGSLLQHLEGIDIERCFIDDLRCTVYRSKRLGLYKNVPVIKTPAYRYLDSRHGAFLKYKQNSYYGITNPERLRYLVDNVRKYGYPCNGDHVILFNNQNLVRDGQHRLAVMRHLWGNVEIPVIRFRFSKSARLPLIKWHMYMALSLRVARTILARLRRGLR